MAQNMDQRIDFFSRLAATERSNEIPESAKDAVARHVTVPQRQGSAVTSLRRFCGIDSAAQPNSFASTTRLALRTRGAQL
jgi:hypothetical protein